MEKEMTEISEQERRSLGQDLHDGICQHLTGVAMMADTLSDSCQRKSLLDVSGKVKALADLIRTAANDARNVARGLQPVELDANGLVSALQTLADRHRVAGKIQCRFQCDRPVPVQDNEVAMHLYRIAQEAVVNAVKHSGARNITIKLGFQKDGIVLSVIDDGKGMPSIQEVAPGPGLRMMRHRASVIGATVAIEPSDRGGTVVRCALSSMP
jgi:two-component system, LuxR family, sensor kinase FixL